MQIWFATACLNTVCSIIFVMVVWSGDSSLHVYGAVAAAMAGIGTVYALRTRGSLREREELPVEDDDGNN